ncbi:MAG TPA: PIN domain-containing protein [Thermoanaerobaculia bacterium]|jgi:PIN domain nuclease of toxin-antitoxin system|nr:PIN domain-containing protein [Thermoanaerobaculia bacterium]
MKAFLDTHAAVFLWEGRAEAFGSISRELLERAALLVSPLVRLELQFLREIGKLKVDADQILGSLISDAGVVVTSDSLESLVPQAMPLSWTRDPFDRLLVATALLHQAPFVTRDRRIHENFAGAVW